MRSPRSVWYKTGRTDQWWVNMIDNSFLLFRYFHVERKHTHALLAKVSPGLPSFPGKAFTW